MHRKITSHFVAPIFALILVGIAIGQDSQAKVISAPEFKLSAEAEAAGIDGTVTIYITVTKEGKVKAARIAAGPAWPCGSAPDKEIKQVGEDIKENILAAKFQPAMNNGKPVEVDLSVSFAIGEAYRQLERKRAREAAIARGEPVPVTVSGGVINGKALSLPKPQYPSEARSQRASGSVSVQVLIDEKGKVIQAGAITGNPLLQFASRDSACGAKFAPTLLEGQPVKVSGVITYNFVP